MKRLLKHRCLGISLLETVLAASLLGGAVMTLCGLSASSLRAIRLNQEAEKAWDYIERQLTLIDIVGVDAMRQSGQTGGQFESLDGNTWHWSVQIAESSLTSLYDVTIRLEWDSGRQRRQIECRTRMALRTTQTDEIPIDDETSDTQAVPAVRGGQR